MTDKPDFNKARVVNFKEALERRRTDAERAKRLGRRSTKSHRKKFQTSFVIFPAWWIDALERANAGGILYRLALALLAEAFKCEQLGGDIVLSSTVVGMHRNSKGWAAMELQRLGLIHIERRRAKQSPVIHILDGIKREGGST